jgi:hypothetical protein
MKIFSKRNFLIGLATFTLGLLAVVSIWGVPGFFRREATITGKVNTYLLDDRGAINGLLLEGGDQLRFSPQIGQAVAARIKVGDEVTAIGHAGTKSQYGREVRVRQISANGQTIVEAEPAPPPHRGKPGQEGRERRPAPPRPDAAPAGPSTPPAAQGDERAESAEARPQTDATSAPQAPQQATTPAPETFTASGNISAHLVNGHGDVDGLILSGGEQVNFSPRIGELVTSAEQGGTIQASVEGAGARSEHGTVIRPRIITVGSQTFTTGR